jgi:hypothetical protein
MTPLHVLVEAGTSCDWTDLEEWDDERDELPMGFGKRMFVSLSTSIPPLSSPIGTSDDWK